MSIGIQARCAARFAAPLEREALPWIAEAAAALLAADGLRPSRLGLIVASNDAGSASALRFWADAQRTGVALASPELFPWCLANALCGALARQFGVTGPNLTLLGEAEALAAALETGQDWLAAGQADAVAVLAVSFGAADGEGRLLGLRLALGGMPPLPAVPADMATLRAAIEALATPGA